MDLELQRVVRRTATALRRAANAAQALQNDLLAEELLADAFSTTRRRLAVQRNTEAQARARAEPAAPTSDLDEILAELDREQQG